MMVSHLMDFGNQGGVLVSVMSYVKRRLFLDPYVIERSYLNLLEILIFTHRLFYQVDFTNPWMHDMHRVKNTWGFL